MSEDVYVLKKRIDPVVLGILNDGDAVPSSLIKVSIRTMENCKFRMADLDDISDWISALKSGKKIVNPLSPREELEMYLTDRQEEAKYPSGVDVRIRVIGIKKGVKKALEIIAKEHPDVADWLKDEGEAYEP
jgi:hypothetical protein